MWNEWRCEAGQRLLRDRKGRLSRTKGSGRPRSQQEKAPTHARSCFSVLHFQEFVGQLSPALLAEVRSIWERPLRILEQVIAEGVRRGELRRCDPWVMANVIWRTGNSAVAALVSPRCTRVIDCSTEAIYDSTLDVLLWGPRRPRRLTRTPSPG